MPQQGTGKENYLVTVLSISAVLGMAVALAVYFAWRAGAISPGFSHLPSAVAVMVCPPFIVAVAFPPASGSDLALTIVAGTIVFANAFLYAGVAAGGYALVTMMMKRRTY